MKKTCKRLTSLLLVLTMACSMVLTSAAAEESDSVDGTADLTVEVASYNELIAAIEGSLGYTDYNTSIVIKLTEDITMTGQIDGYGYGDITIDGDGHTLTGTGGAAVLVSTGNYGSSYNLTSDTRKARQLASLADTSLTFQNITIDASGQQFAYIPSCTSASLTLDGVTLKNADGSAGGGSSILYVTGYSASSPSTITIENTTTEDCTGVLLYGKYINLNIIDSTLTTSIVSECTLSSVTSAIHLMSSSTTAAISGSTISWTDENNYMDYGIYVGKNCLTLEDSTVDGPSPNTATIYCDDGSALTLNSSTIENTDGTAVISYMNTTNNLITDGKVQGSPEIILYGATTSFNVITYGKAIQLTGAMESVLYYSFASDISDTNPVVACSTVAADDSEGYDLTEADLAYLIYSDTSSIRTLELDPSENAAYLRRVELTEGMAELLDSDGTTTVYAYTDTEGNTVYAADTDSVTADNGVYVLGDVTLQSDAYTTVVVPVYSATYHDGEVEPDVRVSTSNGTVVSSGNYNLTYAGENTVDADAEAGTMQVATVTVAPANDLSGNDIVLPYAVEVASYTDLGAEGAPVTVSISYDSSTGDQYTITVKYNDETLVEGTDYQVASYEIDTVNWVANITIEGLGDYGGTYTLSVSIPGKNTMVQTVYSEETLNAALEAGAATIYLSDSFTVTDNVVIDYDVTIDGQGEYAIYVEDADADLIVTSSSEEGVAVLSVQGGSVTLAGLTVDGGDQARCLYVADGASVELTGGSVLTGGGISGTTGGQYGLAIYIAEGGAVTLDDCQVRDSYEHTVTTTSTDEDTGEKTTTTHHYGTDMPIYNLGALTVQDGAYLTNLPSLQSALYNGGTLNWTGGTFDVDLQGYYTNSNYSPAGTVIENQGTFNLSGGTINGFLLARDDNGNLVLDSNGNYTYTADRSTAYFGAIHNAYDAELNMTGGTITGMNTNGSYNGSGGSFYPGGGAVNNNGAFNMSGGTITDSTATDGSTGESMNNGQNAVLGGGGVYNGGVFTMTGGTITNNSASRGGGVYNAEPRAVTSATFDDGGTFIMTGGTITGNTLLDDKYSASSSSTMFGTNSLDISTAGSALYVAGGSTATISGDAVIEGDASVIIDLGTDENGNAVTETVSAGIAVAPTQSERRGASGSGFTATTSADGTLTISGSPTIDVGIVLLNIGSSTETATLLNYGLGGFDASDTSTYVYNITSTEATEVSLASWLALDGDLETALNVASVSSLTASIQLSNVSATGTNISTTLSDTVYKVNTDGDLVAVYTNNRVTVSESDADLFNLADGVSLYLTTTDITDEDGESVTCDAWAICSHSILTHVEAVAATCTEDGRAEYWYCGTCGALFANEGGTIETTEDSLIVAATGHDDELVAVAATDPTCTETGNSRYWYCASCGQLFSNSLGTKETTLEDVTIAATGEHTWNDGEVTTEATCTETGVMTYTCTACGETYTEAIAATGHTWGAAVTENEAAATETEAGSYDLVYYCADCGAELARSTVTVAVAGSTGTTHTWDEGMETAATRYTRGKVVYTCTECGETKTEYTNKVNATFLFDDVLTETSSNDWYYKAVYWAYDIEITKGTSATLFSPNNGCEREQFATFIYRLAEDYYGLDMTLGSTSSPFTDVTLSGVGETYYTAILWCAEHGIVDGYGNGKFGPTDTISREQAVTMLARFEANVMGGTIAEVTETSFSDVSDDWAISAVQWAYENGITDGTTAPTVDSDGNVTAKGVFEPDDDCTRAMMVTYLYRYAAIQD